MQKVKSTKVEGEIVVLREKQKSLVNRIDHLNSQNNILTKNLRKIFSIWDKFFKTIGTIVSIGIAGVVTYGTRNIYYMNGKWSFGVIAFGVLVFFVVLEILLFLTWTLVNNLLVKKMNRINLGGN